MRSPNKKALTAAESAHVGLIKEMRCVVCNESGPSEAHHIEQDKHFLCVPLCPSCHRDNFNGWHGQRRIWNALKMDELSALNETLRRLLA